MKTLISVDWDFFVPEDLAWDLGHQESLMFLKMMWMHRMNLQGKMVTNGIEKNFWKGASGKRILVSDSHALVASALNEVDRVVLYDAHHDCWPAKEPGMVHCHDWGSAFIECGGILEWVYPSKLPCEIPEGITARKYDGHIEYGDAVHICRSGCWTPPWLDKAFIRFVRSAEKELGVKAECLQDKEWNPMKGRFSKQDFNTAYKVQKDMKSLMNKNLRPC